MYRLFYISNVSPFFQPEELEAMCAEFAKKNQALEIGGALIFNGTNFGQVLEGRKQDVIALSERIKLDMRHTSYHVMAQREVDQRYFQDWGMNLVQGFDFAELEKAMQA